MSYTLNTAENIYKAVLDGIKKESTAVLTPEAFNRLINQSALTEWLVDKAGDSDKDQPIVDALRNLYQYTSPISKSKIGKFDLPSDYYRLQSVAFMLEKEGDLLPVNRMRTDSVSVMKVNPFREPTDKRLYYFQQGDSILPYPIDSKAQWAVMYYLKRPDPIEYNPGGKDENGNLLPEQNREVADIAIRMHLERVKEERYQTVLMEDTIRNQKTI